MKQEHKQTIVCGRVSEVRDEVSLRSDWSHQRKEQIAWSLLNTVTFKGKVPFEPKHRPKGGASPSALVQGALGLPLAQATEIACLHCLPSTCSPTSGSVSGLPLPPNKPPPSSPDSPGPCQLPPDYPPLLQWRNQCECRWVRFPLQTVHPAFRPISPSLISKGAHRLSSQRTTLLVILAPRKAVSRLSGPSISWPPPLWFFLPLLAVIDCFLCCGLSRKSYMYSFTNTSQVSHTHLSRKGK